MPTKTYVLDTSVLLAYGKQALSAFGRHEVVIPLIVIKELEGRRHDALVGWIARRVLRELEDLRLETEDHSLRSGVIINDEGGRLRIETNHVNQSDLPPTLQDGRHDTRILAVANNLQKDQGAGTVTLVSNDLTMRILASTSLQLAAESFRTGYKPQGDFSGLVRQEVDHEILTELFDKREINFDLVDLPAGLPANVGTILTAGTSSAVAVRKGKQLKVIEREPKAWGAKGRNVEQRVALQYLLDDDIPVVSMGGPAGTGKSLLALAAGIQKAVEEGVYKKVMVFRPLQAVGNQNLGYLPGTEEEKMAPWAAAVYDALEAVADKTTIDSIVRRGQLEVLPVTHIRGRTFHNAYVVIDEAQNLERATLLAVLSRLGENSKAVFSWDASQRDNLSINNHDGIVPIVDYFKHESEFAHIALRKTERSRVAELATQALEDLDI